MIKGIFFDAAGILYTRSGPTEKYALNLLQKNGFETEISPEQRERQLQIHTLANQGLMKHDAYWDEFLAMRGVTNPDQRKDFYLKIITYSNNVQPVSGAREALLGLKQRGFLLGIITDTIYPIEWKMRRLEKAGVADLIDVVACSSDLGAHKPDPAVYLYALQQAKLQQGEAAFVGHLGIELDGARQTGMITIAIDHDPDASADYYCPSLMDMLNLPILQKA